MIKSNIVERAADVSDAAGSGAWLNTSFRGGMRAVAMAAAATALTAVTAPAQGGLMRDIALDLQHRTLGERYLPGGSALATTGGGTASLRVSASGIGGTLNSSAILLNSGWAVTAYHNIAAFEPFGTITIDVATGSNFNTNRGTVSRVAEYIPFPGGSANNPSLPDLCLLRLTTDLPGVQSALFGSALTGDILTLAGFGRHGSPATGLLERDGNVRAFNAIANTQNSGSYSGTYYSEMRIGSIQAVALDGRGLSGDSGGPIFNAAGELIGMTVAGTLGTQFVGYTTFLRFDNPDVDSWLAATIPTPGSAGLLGLVGLGLGVRRRRS